MLCEKCKSAFQVSYVRWGIYPYWKAPREVIECLSASPLHFSLYSFYCSIITGCYACRQLWATILERSDASKEGRAASAAPFLGDPIQTIPDGFDKFCREFSEHTSTTSTWFSRLLHESVVSKTLFFAIARAIQTILMRCISYKGCGKGREYKWVLALTRIQRRCEQKSGIWLHIDSGENHIQQLCGKTETRLDFSRVYPSARDDTATTAGAISEAQHNTSTAGTAGLWRHWLTTCLTTHSHCSIAEHNTGSFVPKRLIEIVQDDDGEFSLWRLVCDPIHEAIQYMTLSHRWGSYQPIRLDKTTIHEFSNRSPISKLPKTYQHALIITHKLGFRYIWIDSLCILQDEDNKQDWEEQSQLMGSIYSHAVCNIAATWALDGRDGCFSINDPFAREPTRVSLKQSTSSSSYNQYHLWQEDSYYEDVIYAPLNQRGWVLQERYLSRRQLNFAKRQVYWECHERMASEQFPAGSPLFAQLIKTSPRVGNELSKLCLDDSEVRQTWADLVNLYSRCRLTKESDKLVAVSGLAREVGRITKDVCIQGLWKKDFYQQLCWRAIRVGGFGSTTTSGRRNAPSWSWANIDGPIDSASPYSDNTAKAAPWMKVVKWPDPDDRTSRITLRGIILPHTSAEINPRDNHDLELRFREGFNPYSICDNSMRIRIYWDEQTASGLIVQQRIFKAGSRIRLSSELRFLMIFSYWLGWWIRSGLVLLAHSNRERKEYVRVGTFDVMDARNLSYYLASRLECHLSDIEDHLDLDDPRLADIVETVCIV